MIYFALFKPHLFIHNSILYYITIYIIIKLNKFSKCETQITKEIKIYLKIVKLNIQSCRN